ncbi:MAG: phosphate transport system regulatory protein PhoU [Rhodanobacter denitrificans]|uniref:Phosphate-specific transport system accessory protein PhoU n=1 Tax=Rhodanobacter denitrificans TaxID=666685 RepID=A0A2W5K3F1_9GAMM|nr:MAG: phosphate transport system regulatory protein PhoU [Rhodanobacter denitrificans]
MPTSTEYAHLNPHISRQFSQELEDVRRKVLAMGGLVEEQLAVALRVLTDGDARLGVEVTAREERINAAEIEIDSQCTQILARRQPAASDLRLVLTVMKMLGDIERIGDEAKRIERIAEGLIGEDSHGEEPTAALAALGSHARDMLRSALDAFARLDERLALDVIRRDRRIDARYRELLALLTARMRAVPDTIPEELERLWAARSLERIGDRCKNLCEYVLYLVRGKDVRHTGLARNEDAAGE